MEPFEEEYFETDSTKTELHLQYQLFQICQLELK